MSAETALIRLELARCTESDRASVKLHEAIRKGEHLRLQRRLATEEPADALTQVKERGGSRPPARMWEFALSGYEQGLLTVDVAEAYSPCGCRPSRHRRAGDQRAGAGRPRLLMLPAAEARLVLLDASVPYRFCDAQLLPELIRYLSGNTWVTPEVRDELQRGGRRDAHAGLRLLDAAGWPQVTDVLPAHLRREFEHVRRAVREPGDAERHVGEIATVPHG